MVNCQGIPRFKTALAFDELLDRQHLQLFWRFRRIKIVEKTYTETQQGIRGKLCLLKLLISEGAFHMLEEL